MLTINQTLEDAQIYLFKFQNRLGLPDLNKVDNFDSEVLRFISNQDVVDELDLYWDCHNELRDENRKEDEVEHLQVLKALSLNRLEELVNEMNLFGCNQ